MGAALSGHLDRIGPADPSALPYSTGMNVALQGHWVQSWPSDGLLFFWSSAPVLLAIDLRSWRRGNLGGFGGPLAGSSDAEQPGDAEFRGCECPKVAFVWIIVNEKFKRPYGRYLYVHTLPVATACAARAAHQYTGARAGTRGHRVILGLSRSSMVSSGLSGSGRHQEADPCRARGYHASMACCSAKPVPTPGEIVI